MVPISSQPPAATWRQRLRQTVVGTTSPRALGVAAGVGAAMAIAPLPGLQTIIAGLIAWRCKLNMAVVLICSNASFGPLLAVWWAAAIALARWLRLGESPQAAYAAMQVQFHEALGFSGIMQVIKTVLADWVIGCCVVMIVFGSVVGIVTWGIASILRRRDRDAAIPSDVAKDSP